MSPIRSAVKAMSPHIFKVKKRSQGSNKPESAWCRARVNQNTQFLIRAGKLPSQERNGVVPDCFDREKLETGGHCFEPSQVAWWDETHRKAIVGSTAAGPAVVSTKQTYMRFPRDDKGQIDLVNGKYATEEKEYIQCKYDEEARLGLGVAAVDLADGDRVGRRAEPFVYSGKVVITISDYRARQTAEFRRVQSLRVGYWTTSTRIEGALYLNDGLAKSVKNLGKKKIKRLEAQEIFSVGALCELTNSDIDRMI